MKIISSILLLSFSFLTIAQTEGEIIYETKMDMWANLPEGEQGEMIKQFMPQYQTSLSRLLFNNQGSIYKAGGEDIVQESETNLDESDQEVHIEIKMDNPEEIIYTDLVKNLVTEQRELMDKTFLIEDSLRPAAWKITDEVMQVSGMNCQKATMMVDTNEVIAWFTTQIPVSTGPIGYGGLPGLIVHLSLNDGAYAVTAKQIIPRELNKGEITPPTKGKKITPKKFQKLQDKKRKQMEKEYGGQGGIIITTEEG